MSAQDLIVDLQKQDVELWLDEDKLRYSAPPGVMTDDCIRQLAENKQAIVEWLQQAAFLQDANIEPITRVSRDQPLPVSFAQQRLLFIEALLPGNSSYNVSLPLRIRGKLNPAALRKTLDAIMHRHESLRTHFINRGGEYFQIIQPEMDFPLTHVSLAQDKKKQRDARLDQIVAEEQARPFNLHTGPVVRAILVDLEEQESALIISIHHVVSDGWSLGILFKELGQIYSAYAAGMDPEIPPLGIQCADHAVWQRQSLSGGLLQRQAGYWREKLDELPGLQLPTDFNRPQKQSFEGGLVSRLLPESLVASIKQLSEAEGVTLFMTMLAAFTVLLNRYCRQDDIVVGTPIANRNRIDVEELIGILVNMLVMRIDLSTTTDFGSLLALVKKTALEAYRNQDLPFEKLVEELNVERDLSRNPLFQVSFALQEPSRGSFQLDDLSLEFLSVGEKATTRFDLEVNITEGRGHMLVGFVYNPQLFRKSTIEKMHQRFQILLEQIVADPEREIDKLEILTAAERRQLIFDWNRTQTSYPRDNTVASLFEAQVEASPDATALVFRDQSLSYAELNCKANQLAHYLTGRDVRAGVMVGICLERSLDLVVSILAIAKAGGVYIPLDAEYPRQRLSFMLEDSAAAILLTQSALLERLPDFSGQVICIDRQWPEIEEQDSSNPVVALGARDLIYVMYTSGSTGQPKGVCIEQRSVNRLVKSTSYIDAGPADTFLLSAPVSFDASTLEIWGSLLNGAKLVVYPEQKIALEQLGQVLEKNRVTILWLTSALFGQMVEQQLQSFTGVTTLLAGGEALSVKQVNKYLGFLRENSLSDHRLINGYGPTENTTFTCCHPMNAETRLGDTVPIGKPISNTSVYILDENRNLVPPGITGELFIGGDGLARGYLNRPELTDEKFVSQNFAETEALRLYRTGDLVRYTEDGEILFVGRVDNQIKLRGYRIELGEIESLLNEHEAVSESLVVLREDRADDRRLVAYLVPAKDCGEKIPEIRDHCQRHLPAYMLPSAFVLLEQFPLTSNGKIDRDALPPPDGGRRLEHEFVAARGRLEKALAEIWKAVLGLDEVGVRDNFFDLGGHSLLATQVVSLIHEQLGLDVPLAELFAYPTIESLARFLEAEQQPAPNSQLVERRPAHRRETGLADESIAVVGMAGRFPDSPNLQSFWRNLVEGVESIRFFSEDELRDAGLPDEVIRNPAFVAARGFLDDVEMFDANFFGYSASEAELIDPQQRIFLETSYHALEHAAYDPQTYPGLIAVFAGTSVNTYQENIRSQPDLLGAAGMQLFISSEKDFVATRVAYKLGLKGPGLTIQTACSTSLVAIHEACRSLQHFDCDIAIAGGVSVTVPRVNGYIYQPEGILSPDGHCRTFDASAEGTVVGEGVGAVVLKRLQDAIDDRDTIHAVIRGSAINNDGSDKAGFTAPGIQGQVDVIRMAQASAGVAPESIGFIETHGTATSLGDPIEVIALTQAFGPVGEDKFERKHCALGALKQNLGHLDSAAGVASFIKAVLAIENGKIPPSPNYRKPNPRIDFANSPFYVNTTAEDWLPGTENPRRAGISSFGIGGTNAHVIIEQAPAPAEAEPEDVPAGREQGDLIVLSAKSEPALQSRITQLAEYLQQNPGTRLCDIAFTLQTGRTMFKHRAVLVANETGEIAQQLLQRDPERLFIGSGETSQRNIVFMFSGQGSQYPNMARDLYQKIPEFRVTVDACCETLQAHLDCDLRELLFPIEAHLTSAEERLTQTAYAQPALFVIEYATAKLWLDWGVRPAAMIGHSIGEYVAACLCGVFALDDALMLVASRGRLMQERPAGAMLSVPLAVTELEGLIPADLQTRIAIATVNTPSMCVAAGEQDDIESLKSRLEQDGHAASLLHTSHAFHSPVMDALLEPFRQRVSEITLQRPEIPFISNLSGDWIDDEQAVDPVYWARHLRHRVQFSDGIKTLLAQDFDCFIEMGPGNTLTSFVRQQTGFGPQAETISLLTSIRHPQQAHDDARFILQSLGRLWLDGQPLNWELINPTQSARRIPLPAYPFERKRFWVEAPSARTLHQAQSRSGKIADIGRWSYVPAWKSTPMLVAGRPRDLKGSWLVFANDSVCSEALGAHIEQQGGRVIRVTAEQCFAIHSPQHYGIDPARPEDYLRLLADDGPIGERLAGIFHCWGVTADGVPGLDDGLMRCEYYSLLFLAQSLVDSGRDLSLHIDVLTQHSQAVDKGDPVRPEKSMSAALLRVISQENIGIKFTLYDLVDADIAAGIEALPERVGLTPELQSILLAQRMDSENRVIAFRRERRWLQIYERIALNQDPADGGVLSLRERGIYLITGGLGGVGFVMASYLASTVGARLVLTARSALGDPEQWDDRLAADDTPAREKRIMLQVRRLQSLGAEVTVRSVDASDLAGMRALVDDISANIGPVNGVIHAAGVVAGDSMRSLQSLTLENCEAQFAPKIHGLLILQQLFEDYPLDFLMPVSSLSAVLGGLGFAAYGPANQFMDSLSQLQHNRGKRHWISVNWDGWQFDEISANGEFQSPASDDMEGALYMTADEGKRIFAQILNNPQMPQIVISSGDLDARLQRWVYALAPEAEDSTAGNNRYERPTLSSSYVAAETDTQRKLAAIWQALFKLSEIGIHDNFFELGGHSLLAVQAVAAIRTSFDVNLPIERFLELGTVEKIAEHIDALAWARQNDAAQMSDDDSREEFEL